MVLPISVVLPCYNRAYCLRRSLDSILKQSQSVAEIIVVDDGSTDNTASLLDHYASDIHVIHQENRGVSAARNTGINNAQHEWIALLDSDDAWLPQKIERQWAYQQQHPDATFIHCDEIWMRHGHQLKPMRKHQKGGGDQFSASLAHCMIAPSSTLIHRKMFETIGLFDETLPACEDYDLWLRITATHCVHYLPTPLLVKYGGHSDQLSKKYWGMDRFRIQSLEKLLQSSILSDQQERLALQMLIHKINIVLNGARKRNKTEAVKRHEHKLTQYQQVLLALP